MPNSSKSAWAMLRRRWEMPQKQWSFWTFLVVGILVLGGLAVWIELYRYFCIVPEGARQVDLASVRLALATAGLAIAGPASMQLFYSRDKMAIVVAIILFTIVMILAMFLIVFGEPAGWGTLFGGVFCLIPSILAWMLANGEDKIFQDEVSDDAPAGGSPMREMPPIKAKVSV